MIGAGEHPDAMYTWADHDTWFDAGPEDGVEFARDGFVRLTSAGAEQAGTNAVGLDFFTTTSASCVGSTATRAAQERREPAA